MTLDPEMIIILTVLLISLPFFLFGVMELYKEKKRFEDFKRDNKNNITDIYNNKFLK